MKSFFFTYILPLSLLSQIIITKWWYGAIIDGADEYLFGFPFISRCRGFGTSLSTQYFVIEFILNFLIRLSFWTIFILVFKRYLKKININPIILKVFYSLVIILLSYFIVVSNKLNDYYLIKRNFEVEIFDSRLIFIWKNPDKRDNYKNEYENWIEKNN